MTVTTSDDIKHLAKLIHGIDMCMLTTVDKDGTLRSRPMSTQKDEFDGTLWFFTKVDSPKSHEIEAEHQVNLSYADPRRNHYVSVSGHATICLDRAKMKELWNPLYKAWFPDGLEDPEIALLRVEATKAEYWDVKSGMMVQLVGFIKAIVTGKEYHPGNNEKIDLSNGVKQS